MDLVMQMSIWRKNAYFYPDNPWNCPGLGHCPVHNFCRVPCFFKIALRKSPASGPLAGKLSGKNYFNSKSSGPHNLLKHLVSYYLKLNRAVPFKGESNVVGNKLGIYK